MTGRAAFGVAVIATIAVTFYAGYQIGQHDFHHNDLDKALVVSGLGMAGRVKIAVAAFHSENGRLPASNTEAGLPDARHIADRFVSSIAIGPQGVITVTYRGHPEIEGKTVLLTPAVADNSAAISWSCSEGTLPARLRPETCR